MQSNIVLRAVKNIQIERTIMHTENLKESLKELHANLETTGEMDGELKELLLVLDKDIRQLLDKQERAQEDALGLADRAQSISARFAAEHPAVETALRELGVMLSNMGI